MAELVIPVIYASAGVNDKSQKIKDVIAFPEVIKFSFVFEKKECKFCSLPAV